MSTHAHLASAATVNLSFDLLRRNNILYLERQLDALSAEYKALKACLGCDGRLCFGCAIGNKCSDDMAVRLSRLLELHGEMVAQKIVEKIGDFGVPEQAYIDIVKSVEKE